MSRQGSQKKSKARRSAVPGIDDKARQVIRDIRAARQESFRDVEAKEFKFGFANNPILEAGEKIHQELEALRFSKRCCVCHESWLGMTIMPGSGMCKRCHDETKKLKPGDVHMWGVDNDMIPAAQVPDELACLNEVELGAIRLITPIVIMYRRQHGGSGSRGHTVAFDQDVEGFGRMLNALPRTPAELPIVILESPDSASNHKFPANRNKILAALEWLKLHNPYYQHITISLDNLAMYPQTPEESVEGIRTILCETTAEEEQALTQPLRAFQVNQDDIDVNDAIMEDADRIPVVDSAYRTVEQRSSIVSAMKQVTDSMGDRTSGNRPPQLPWPQRSKSAVSEWTKGFFTMSCPHLFPDGKADIRNHRHTKVESLAKWASHLMRVDRRFANDNLFAPMVNNQIHRHKAITLGNVYAKRVLEDLNIAELKKRVEAGDEKVLRDLMYSAAGIPGSRQYFLKQRSLGHAFVRHVRIASDDEEMFNLFLTFSPADIHWPALHQLLPGSSKYLGKTVVKRLEDIPEGEDPLNYITQGEDYRLRMDAVNRNQDICNFFFRRQLDLLFEHILIPIFGVKDYIVRFEFQHRGSIHTHMIVSAASDLTPADLERACQELSSDNAKEVLASRHKLIDFAVNDIGINCVHPSKDPMKWIPPHGQNIYPPSINCLRQPYTTISKDEETLHANYEFLTNRTLHHTCRVGYCKPTVEAECRFRYPQDYLGFEPRTEADANNAEREFLVEVKRLITEGLEPQSEESVTDINAFLGATFTSKGEFKYLRNHPDLVNHIPELLLVWRANIESKVVTSFPQLLKYILKYVLKPEEQSATLASILAKVSDKCDDDAPIKRVFQKLLMTTVSDRDVSRAECFQNIHGEEHVKYSKKFRTASLDGSRALNMEARQDSEPATKANNWVEVYAKREQSSEFKALCAAYEGGTFKWNRHPSEISLHEFMANFSLKWKPLPQPNSFVPVFYPSFTYKVSKGSKNYESWCRSLLLSEKPGCYTSNVGQGFESMHAELEDFVKNSAHCPKFVKKEFEEAQKTTKEEEEPKEKSKAPLAEEEDLLLSQEEEGDPDATPPEWYEVYGMRGVNAAPDEADVEDAASNYDEFEFNEEQQDIDWEEDISEIPWTEEVNLDTALSWLEAQSRERGNIPDPDLDNVDPSKLNARQRKAYDMVCSWVVRRLSSPTATKPIYINLCGPAGCGKTFWLMSVIKFITENAPTGFIKLAAPTGTAAFAINGATLHSMFKLPRSHAQGKEIPDLSPNLLHQLQLDWKNTQLLAIDEKSMVGLDTLNMINKRLREVKPDAFNTPFGGVSIVLMGDFAQLPPVGDKPLYFKGKVGKGKNDISVTQSKAAALYQLFDIAVHFTEIMRQQGPEEQWFREMLGRIVDGTFSMADWRALQTQDFNSMSQEEKHDFESTAIKLCARNVDLIKHNNTRMRQLGTPIALVKAKNNPAAAAIATSSKAEGLQQQIIMAKHAEMVITRNLWREAGLTNGARCVIRHILYKAGRKPPQLPDLTLVHVPQYKGPDFLGMDRVVPITPVTGNFWFGGKNCTRTMVPLIPGYAISIHKSQGMSMDKIIIDIWNKEFALGLTYTAISRCKKLKNLAFDPYPSYQRIGGIFHKPGFKTRREEDKRLLDMDSYREDEDEQERRPAQN